MNVLAALSILGLLILIHEAGHFLAAILQGIRVIGFSIGFGPALIKKELNGISASLRQARLFLPWQIWLVNCALGLLNSLFFLQLF